MTFESLALWACFVVIAYAIVANRLLYFARPFRDRALDLGSKLLEDPTISDTLKKSIKGDLEGVPHALTAWKFVVLIFCATVMVFIKRVTGAEPNFPDHLPKRGTHQWALWDRFTDSVIIATVCNSPLATAIVLLELMLASFVFSTNKILHLAITPREHVGHKLLRHS